MPTRRAILVVSENCTGCQLCRLACSHIKTSAFGLSQALIKIDRVGFDERYVVGFTPECDRCGFCVNYCCFGAIERAGPSGTAKT